MKKALVLGGTRFFGKRLVTNLIDNGLDVTLLTRGNTKDDFGDSVKRLKADRKDYESLKQAVGRRDYDIIYDNICYTPEEAEDMANLVTGRVGHYVLTSTLSVYDFADHPLKEHDFDPYRYPVMKHDHKDYSYKEGKRQAEAVLFSHHDLNVAAVRFPIVLGIDDYTRRLLFHIEHALKGEPIGLPAPDALISFIHAEEAAQFLYWVGKTGIEGPVNACSAGAVSVREIMDMIYQEYGKTVNLQTSAGAEHMSPFGIPGDWTMDHSLAASAGFNFWSLKEWMPKLIADYKSIVPL
ncbi:NAD-dependent epimerase/dehydratase family protein [Paenibacillus dakarensis]|uniref:NAD-dependent epimerase/dehydratase family protein n=1 Tax=Paenibacillus dakarensis TaxID=1527293 RepID=UPI0006D5590D|nr:NAD-dependent epimerase/dehydratase family protein [Paenibacillus dakarensis]